MAYRRGRVQQDGDRRRGSCMPPAPRAFLPTTAPALPELAPPKSVLAHAARGWVEPPTMRRPSTCALLLHSAAVQFCVSLAAENAPATVAGGGTRFSTTLAETCTQRTSRNTPTTACRGRPPKVTAGPKRPPDSVPPLHWRRVRNRSNSSPRHACRVHARRSGD